MTTRFHTTASGHRIEYEATPEIEAFLRRLQELVTKGDVSSQAMTGIAYSSENPILDHAMFAGRGAVTREVLENPAYAVVTDLLFRKTLTERGQTPDDIAEHYSMSVSDAAVELGIHESAVRQAIAAKRLASWLKDGRHYVDPRALKTLEVGTRGPRRADATGGSLTVCVGNTTGQSFNVRTPTPITSTAKVGANKKSGVVEPGWRRLVVRSIAGAVHRTWILEPGPKEAELVAGDFYVRGRFAIAESATTPKKADTWWRERKPE
jgi:hypothetical protein